MDSSSPPATGRFVRSPAVPLTVVCAPAEPPPGVDVLVVAADGSPVECRLAGSAGASPAPVLLVAPDTTARDVADLAEDLDTALADWPEGRALVLVHAVPPLDGDGPPVTGVVLTRARARDADRVGPRYRDALPTAPSPLVSRTELRCPEDRSERWSTLGAPRDTAGVPRCPTHRAPLSAVPARRS